MKLYILSIVILFTKITFTSDFEHLQPGRPKTQSASVEYWCKIPCWGTPCEDSCPESCLSRYNRNQDEIFAKTFHRDGPWNKPGNPIKSCCVQYLRNTTSHNCTTLTAISAAAVALTCAGALAVGVGSDCAMICCTPNGCLSPSCAKVIGDIVFPAGCDLQYGLCCPPNSYNFLIWLGEAACIASPFGGLCLDINCTDYLSNTKNWENVGDEDRDDEPFDEI